MVSSLPTLTLLFQAAVASVRELLCTRTKQARGAGRRAEQAGVRELAAVARGGRRCGGGLLWGLGVGAGLGSSALEKTECAHARSEVAKKNSVVKDPCSHERNRHDPFNARPI